MFARTVFTAALALCALAPMASEAGPFSNLYVFGDSLSDGGSDLALSAKLAAATNGAFPLTPGAPGNFQGRFSNGKVAVDYLATSIGLPLTAHYLSPPFLGGATGGNNYAQGGATSGLTNASLPTVLPGTNLPTGFKGVLGEIADYAATTPKADAGALYVVWSGANDFLHLGSVAAAPGCAGSVVAIAVCTAVRNVTTSVVMLAQMGATRILVPNLPDLGETPSAITAGTVADAHAISVAYNTALAASLAGVSTLFPGEIIPFDLFGLFNEVLANPGAFGLSNTTMACLNGSAADVASTPTAACNAIGADKYLFWDDVHPTTAAQAIIGQRLAAAVGVPEPSEIALFAIGLIGLGAARRRRR